MGTEKQTHIVTKPNVRPATPIEQIKVMMHKEWMTQVQNYFGGNDQEALRFKTSCIDLVRRNPRLLECDRVSLMVAFIQTAQFRFMPSSVGGESYIIPYGREAKFQIGYQGLVTLFYRTDKISTISANIVYENDTFQYEEGLEPKLIHIPALFGKPKGEPIGTYVVAKMKDGGRSFKVMDKDAVMAIKNISKAKASKESPWNSEKDPNLWMWKKTCLIQLAKVLPKTQDIQKALETDYEGEGVEKHHLDAEGPATLPANHRPEDTTVDPGTKKIDQREKQQKVDDDIPIIEENGGTTNG